VSQRITCQNCADDIRLSACFVTFEYRSFLPPLTPGFVQLQPARMCHARYGPHSFHFLAPHSWNTLPSRLEDINTNSEQYKKSGLKTWLSWLFVQARPTYRRRLLRINRRHKNVRHGFDLIWFCLDTVASVEMRTYGSQTTEPASESPTHSVGYMKIRLFLNCLQLIIYNICYLTSSRSLLSSDGLAHGADRSSWHGWHYHSEEEEILYGLRFRRWCGSTSRDVVSALEVMEREARPLGMTINWVRRSKLRRSTPLLATRHK